ncbi:MAG: cell division protein FtsH, partial [Pseudomonadota bacterium]|nr:cell division protein FtsH [Pseudomonadota bacterium]
VTQHKNISEDTARMVDEEIHKILIDAYERAKGVITGHMDDLRHLAENLREYETLTGEEIKIICNGGTIDRPESPPPPPPKKTKPVVTSKASVPTGGGESKTE